MIDVVGTYVLFLVDKSGDAAEIAQLRQDIGMPPDTSRERTRQD